MNEDDTRSEKAYRQRVRRAGLGMRLARSAFRKRKRWIDRLFTRLIARLVRPRGAGADFMRDEIVDAGIGFDAEDLRRYQESGSNGETVRRP